MDASTWIDALLETNLDNRRQAAQALAQHREAAQAAVIPLCRAASDGDEQVREWCHAALEELGPPPEEERDALLDLITAEELTAYWAVTLLGRLGNAAQPAALPLAALVERTETPDEVRNRALWALGKIGGQAPEIRAALERAAQNENPRTARLAAKALATP